MPTHTRAYSKDEEHGKRDDDFRPRINSLPSNFTRPWRWRKRRLFAAVALLVLAYVFVHNIPTDLGSIDERVGIPLRPGHVIHGSQELREPKGAPPRKDDEERECEGCQYYYNGPVKFYRLASSLHGISRTMGANAQNRNVLYAASSLKSVANLIPHACEMAKKQRNYVHLAVMGRDPLPLEDIIDVNGVDLKMCTVYFHDARGDFTEFSTDFRAEVAVGGAMKHIHDFMHPQAIITDDSSLEDHFFTRTMRKKARDFGKPLIEVPAGRYEDFLWMTRLDSSSLASWFIPSFDILIQAPRDSAGSLLRLVKSLENADYAGVKPPKLTIELPSQIEPVALKYLEAMDWPPTNDISPLKANTLSLRHRIPYSRLTTEQASLRFLELFYPSGTDDNHVIVLSSQVEIGPLFLQYLHYLTLELKYSSYSSSGADDLLGISLDVPNASINGSGDFKPPTIADVKSPKKDSDLALDSSAASPFLYQAPSSTASLFFGEKWAELHDFLTNRLSASHLGVAQRTKKLVSETEPAWLEYLLELMRARGSMMLYPATSLVTVHNELAQIPEEYLRPKSSSHKSTEMLSLPSNPEDEPFLTAPDPPSLRQHPEEDMGKGALPLHEMFPFSDDLLELSFLPYIMHTGELIDPERAYELRGNYTVQFRNQIGGCTIKDAKRARVIHYAKTDDLFCLPGLQTEYEEAYDGGDD